MSPVVMSTMPVLCPRFFILRSRPPAPISASSGCGPNARKSNAMRVSGVGGYECRAKPGHDSQREWGAQLGERAAGGSRGEPAHAVERNAVAHPGAGGERYGR